MNADARPANTPDGPANTSGESVTKPWPLWMVALGALAAAGGAIHGYLAAHTRVVRDAIRSRRTK